MKLSQRFAMPEGISAYFIILYLLLLPVTAAFAALGEQFNGRTLFFLAVTVIAYTFCYTLPVLLLGFLAHLGLGKLKNGALQRKIVFGITAFGGGAVNLLLLADFGMLRSFDFHFNMMILNLLTTPGGFASMGLRSGTILPLAAVIIAVLGIHIGIGAWCESGNFARRLAKFFSAGKKIALFAVMAVLFLTSSLMYGYEHFMLRPDVLAASGNIPLYQPMTIRSLMKKMGFAAPDATVMKMRTGKGLNYPLKPVVRTGHKKYNVIFLVCESLRGDALNPEVMPNVWEFAKRGVRFTDHYSGGNGTRMGVFSIFYALYGSYWHEFLQFTRPPLFMDWLKEDGYEFFCSTSAKFTYPEFDRTVFAGIAPEKLYSDDTGLTWERDRKHLQRILSFLKAKPRPEPFMLFHFFESPHAPYEFPADAVLYPDAAKSINYVTVSAADGAALKKRYYNACFHLDQCLGKVLETLKAENLLDNSIVVITGDHGEEFFEKGHLGHNSTFVEEQIRPPLVIAIPGVAPQVISRTSSHMDIVPMLAKYFGVQNPPEDYSLGVDILAGASRDHVIVSDWSRVAFVSKKYKTVLPTTAAGFATQKLADGNDQPLDARDKFYQEMGKTLMDVQRNLTKFSR